MSSLSYAVAKVTTGFRITDALLNLIESGFRKVSHALLGDSCSLIPTVKEQIFQTLNNATVGSMTIDDNGQVDTFGNASDGGPH
ncbi:hypothetical protein LPJ78_005874, partial [Coemansia sp. RSA 989]